jgi:hypothetical protein
MASINSFPVHPAVTPDLALAAVASREQSEEEYAEFEIVYQIDKIRTSPASTRSGSSCVVPARSTRSTSSG